MHTLQHLKKTAQNNFGTDRVATPGGRFIHIRRTSHNCLTVFARWRPLIIRLIVPTTLTVSNGSSIGSAVFALLMPHSMSILYVTLRHPIPQKAMSLCRGLLIYNTWFHRPIRLTTPKRHRVESAVLPQYTLVTDGQNDDGTRTKIYRLCILCATRPTNLSSSS